MVQELKHVKGYEWVCKVPFKEATIMMFDGKVYAFSPDEPPHYLDVVAKEFKKLEMKE
jgi:hypothetical protein